MTIPKGGRGKKAPYDTRTVRVPVDLIPQVENLIEVYREAKLNDNDVTDIKQSLDLTKDNLEKWTLEAKAILKQKKSAKESMKKLLALMFSGEEINL